MRTHAGIRFRFWGVRGSIATPGPSTVRYGGNTPCVAIEAGGRHIIFDGGTGLRALGESMLRQAKPIEADLFLSHLHWDHIQGIPFFRPAFRPGNRFRVHGEGKGGTNMRTLLEEQMRNPNFPVPLSTMRSAMTFHQIEAGESVVIEDVVVRTAPLNHPNGCLGLRADYAGRSVTYCTDTEHDHLTGEVDARVVELARGSDVLIYDAMYTEEEYRAGRIGWGHSTYEEAIRVARAAEVKRLFFFHHEPCHDDVFLDARLAEARAATQGDAFVVDMAREGVVFEI